MIEEIEQWLEGDQDYSEGVGIYQKYGTDSALLSLFKLSETSFTREQLFDALRDLIPSEKPEQEEKKGPGTPPEVLDLIRKRSQLHESLFHTTSKSDRYKIAASILAIGKKLDRYYDDGELPGSEAENSEPENSVPVNGWELHMMINNNIAYMAKNKKRPEKQGEVSRRERQNREIEERLKAMDYGVVS